MPETGDSLKEWTVMFLIAGDNDLAPVFISQLKAIKDAGFQKQVDVLVHFDPSERRTPTKLLHVNRKRRGQANGESSVGPRDSFVRNMREDIIEPHEIEGDPRSFAGKMREGLRRSDKVPAEEALRNFIGFCREKHPAKNYILFLVGHGLVVGNDAFLPDENPRSALTLQKLGAILKEFTNEVEKDDGVFQLLALHSCAMSAVEVAYEMRGTARFMMGSEGISFMGSWPYLNMLMRIFNGQEKADQTAARANGDLQAAAAARAANINETIKDLYFHSLFGAKDFMYAGYSHDLALCSLEPESYVPLTGDMKTLSASLKEAVKTDRGRELILLAHWEAQSYWEENYTDIYDFCLCLRRRLPAGGELDALRAACEAVIARLEPQGMVYSKGGPGPVVLFSENFGSRYQYSHGLSVYFPWSEPLDDEPLPPEPVSPQANGPAPAGAAAGVLKRYAEYAFTKELGKDDSWLSFLKLYFELTKRKTRDEEEGRGRAKGAGPMPFLESDAHLFGAHNKPISSGDKPIASGGAACTCPTIKNYPTRELELELKDGKKRTVTVKDVFVSEGLRQENERRDDE